MSPVESIERATVGAVAPLEALEIGGWLVALDPGTIRRAGSAVPLSHDLAPDAGVLNAIEAAYAELVRRLCGAVGGEAVSACATACAGIVEQIGARPGED